MQMMYGISPLTVSTVTSYNDFFAVFVKYFLTPKYFKDCMFVTLNFPEKLECLVYFVFYQALIGTSEFYVYS